jgi:putative CocE/NonD family hydrolase
MKMRVTRCSVVLLIIAARTLGAQGFDVIVHRNVMVPMRDGIRLATDLYFPARNGAPAPGTFPAILVRTPYGKAEEAAYMGDSAFARNGYVVVYQDTRGRFDSEGTWHFMTDDGRDGRDACEWIGRQAWSDGHVGMMGVSYVGGTQHALAMEGCPYLKTVVPTDAVSNMGYQSVRNGGAFELRIAMWPLYGAATGSHAARNPATKAVLDTMFANRRAYLDNYPFRRGTTPLTLAPEYEEFLVEAIRAPGGSDFWQQNNIRDFGHLYQDIPVYLVGGWYDSWGGNTSTNYQVLSRRLTSPVYLIFGPWIHGEQGDSAHGQVNFGSAAAIPDTKAWHLMWFDRWLKGVDNDGGRQQPFSSRVRIFVMGTGDGHRDAKGRLYHGGYWRDEMEWPLARTQPSNYYLHRGGRLATQAPVVQSASTTYDFDPRDPVPTIGGNISFAPGLMQPGAWDQRGGPTFVNWPSPLPISARRDVLVFQSDPLDQDLEVTGDIRVSLWVSSTALDTDFTAKLIDVYPPSPDFPQGFDLNIEDGIIRARYRESLATERLLTPNTVVPVTILLYPTSNVFKKGHRIRLDVSSSNYPRFDINPNSGEPLGDHRRMVTATNTIWHDASHPSSVTLPVIPATAGSSPTP